MKIIQSVIVKQVLTDSNRDSISKSFQQTKDSLQKEIEQLQFLRKRQEKQNIRDSLKVIHSYQKEIESRQEKIRNVEFQIEQLQMLPVGSEIKERELDAIIDIKIGDKWEDYIKPKTIIVKEGIVYDIR